MRASDYKKLEEYYKKIVSLGHLIPELRPLHVCHTKNYMFYIRYLTRLSLAVADDDYEKVFDEIEELLYEREYLLQPHVYYNILMFLEKLLNKRVKKKIYQKKALDEVSSLSEYAFAIYHINCICDDKELTIQKKLIVLNDLLEAIKLDIQYGSFTSFLYTEFVDHPGALFPFNDISNSNPEIKQGYVNFNDVTVFSRMYSVKKYSNCLIAPFKYKWGEHIAVFYTGLDILLIIEGKHHAVKTKMYNTGGNILATIVDVNEHLGELYSDGKKWYRSKDNKELCYVDDFRLPIILYIYEKIVELQRFNK